MIIQINNPDRFRAGDSVLIDGDVKYVTGILPDSISVSDEKPAPPWKGKRNSTLRRSKRPLKARTLVKPTLGMDEEYKAFMGSFSGQQSIVSGKTRSSVLKDENGKPLKTEGHHLLPQSIYPEHRLNPENIVVLTREEHGHVEDHPKDFEHWIHDHCPLRWKWMQEHKHHRK